MKNTRIAVAAMILLVGFQLIDAITVQNWFQIRIILMIEALLLALFTLTIIIDHWKRKRNKGNNENS